MKIETPTTAPKAPQAESLDLLIVEATAAQAKLDEASKPAKPPEPTVNDLKAEVLETLKIVRGITIPIASFSTEEKMMKRWSDQVLNSIAEPAAEIMQRHGWTMGGFMVDYGCYIALGLALFAPAAGTYREFKDSLKVAAPLQPAPVQGASKDAGLDLGQQ